MVQITALSLFIINRVLLRRLTLGISAKSLSRTLGHSPNYVITIENKNKTTSYPPHEWPKLATALNCQIHDLLPNADSNSTGELVDKKVLNLSIESDLKLVFKELVYHGFFNQEKSIQDVADHLFIRDEEQLKIIDIVLNRFVKDGLLQPMGNSIFIINDQNKKL